MKKLKSSFLLASALTLTGIAPIVITSVDSTQISTYDQSPAASRQEKVETKEGYRVSSETISLDIRGTTYNDIKLEVYLTNCVYMYGTENDNGIDYVIEKSNVLGFYVKLDMSQAKTDSGTSYVYQNGDEQFFRVNLYPANYDTFNASNSYQEDIMYAEFYKHSTKNQFYSYQILIPQIEMGWKLEVLNDSDATNTSEIDFMHNSSTISVYNDSYLVSDYWTDSLSANNSFYDYANSDQQFVESPYIEIANDSTNTGKDTYYNADTNVFQFSFNVYFDFSNSRNFTTSISDAGTVSNGRTIVNSSYCQLTAGGYLYLPVSGTSGSNQEYVILEINKWPDSQGQCSYNLTNGFTFTNTTEYQDDEDSYWDVYHLYEQFTYTFNFSNASSNSYETRIRTYNVSDNNSESIYQDISFENVNTTDLFSYTGVSEFQFDSYYIWEEVEYTPYVSLMVNGSVDINEDGDLDDTIDNSNSTYPLFENSDRIVEYNRYNEQYYTDYTKINYSGYVYYDEQTYDDAYASVTSIDNPGDIGSTIIGWLFLGISITLIVGIVFYIVRKNKLAKAKYDQKIAFIKKGESLNGK